MAVEQFLDQVSPVPEHNYFRSVLTKLDIKLLFY